MDCLSLFIIPIPRLSSLFHRFIIQLYICIYGDGFLNLLLPYFGEYPSINQRFYTVEAVQTRGIPYYDYYHRTIVDSR